MLIRISVPANPQDDGAWLSENWTCVSLALNLVPFAGIAFLWFIGVVCDRLGDSEDHFFATVFLGSGLLFLGMLFTSAAIAGGMIAMFGANPNELIETGVYSFGRTATYQIMTVYTMKMASVFMLSTCTLSLRTGIFPRWMALLGMTLALFLLLRVNSFYRAPFVFLLWIILIRGHILLANFRKTSSEPAIAALP